MDPLPRRFRSLHWVWLLAAVSLISGTWLRLAHPGLTPYGLDEGIASILTVQLTERGQIPLVGVKTSLHFYNPPLLPWLLAPAFLVSPNPEVATFMVALLGMAACVGIGWCAWRLGGRNATAGALALALAALAPFWIEYSRRLWGHALILPATVLALVFAIRWMIDGRRWALAGLIASVAAAQALHFSGALLWVAFGLIAWGEGRRRKLPWSWPAAGTGIAIAMLWYGPYALHVIRTDFEDVKIIAATLAGHARIPTTSLASAPAALWMLLADGLHHNALGHSQVLMDGLEPWRTLARAGSLALTLMGLGLACLHVVTSLRARARGRGTGSDADEAPALPAEDSSLLRWGLILALVPATAFSLVHVAFVPPYLLPGAPGVVLLAAGALERGLRSRRPGLSLTARTLLFAWIVSALGLACQTARVLAHANPQSTVFTTLRHQHQAVRWIVEESGSLPVQVTQGERRRAGLDFNLFYLFWAETGEPERFQSHEASHRLFIVRDSKDRLSPDYAHALGSLPHRVFGNLTVYEAAPDAKVGGLGKPQPFFGDRQ